MESGIVIRTKIIDTTIVNIIILTINESRLNTNPALVLYAYLFLLAETSPMIPHTKPETPAVNQRVAIEIMPNTSDGLWRGFGAGA